MKYFSLILIHLFFLNACYFPTKDLGDYREVKELFEENEIRELEQIIDSFEEAICVKESRKRKDVELCYELFFERTLNFYKKGELKIDFPLKETFVNKINNGLFNQIWVLNKGWNNASDTIEILNINPEGKYIQLLKILGKENGTVESYTNRLLMVGGIGPTSIADVIINYENYDLKDERIKLFIVVHYLTLNNKFKTDNPEQ